MAPRKGRLYAPTATDALTTMEPRRSLRNRKAQAGESTATALRPSKTTSSANATQKQETTQDGSIYAPSADRPSRRTTSKRTELVSPDVTTACNPHTSKLLELPVELLQNICLSPSLKTRDVVAFSQTCRTFSKRLDNFFWYQRLNVGQQYISVYDPKKDYSDDVLRSCCGWTGGRLGDGIDHKAKVRKGRMAPNKATNLTARQEKWMALSLSETFYYRCQSCCYGPAERYYPNFRLSLCYYCIREHAIATTQLRKFFPKLQIPINVRQEPFVKGISPEYVWIADLDAAAISIYGATVRKLLDDRQKAIEQNLLAVQNYRDRHRDLTVEHCMKYWAEPQYDQFREVITTEMMEKHLRNSVDQNNFLDGLRKPPPFDRTEPWFRDRFNEYLDFLRDEKDCYAIMHTARDLTTEANLFHLRRLIHSLDAGGFTRFDPAFWGGQRIPNRYTGHEFTSSSDGKVLVGACKICYDNIKDRFLQHKTATRENENRGLEAEKEETIEYLEDFRDRCHIRDSWPAPWGRVFYKNHSALGLVTHYEQFHRGMLFSRELNPNGEWFTFMSNVAGLEPKRVLSMEEDVRRIPLPGGPYVLKFFKRPQTEEVV